MGIRMRQPIRRRPARPRGLTAVAAPAAGGRHQRLTLALLPLIAAALLGGAVPAAAATAATAAAAAAAATPPPPSPPSPPSPGEINGLPDVPNLKALKYRPIGPAWGGRVARVKGVAGNASVFYLGSASGGVWRSTDGGITWSPIFDEQPATSIGSLALAPSDPNVLYVGTGEANLRGNAAPGDGIYKSVDGGKTWTHALALAGHIGTVTVDPRAPDVAFAAVLGHGFGPNPERGVYRTRDGGKTWQQVLKKDADTGASDVALDPSNPNIVFAGLWQVRRRPWALTSGGPGSGLYMSRDGGDTWKQLTGKGLPEGIWGKVGVAVAPSDGRRVYALIEAEEGGLFRSDDGGDSWTRASGSHELRQRAFYYSTITVAPGNPDDLWCPQVTMLHSIDGGKTFQHVKMHHGDHHDVWIDPKNPKRIIAGNDGGVDISTDGGATWTVPALPLGQLYHVSVDSRVPFRVAGAQQDLGTAQGPSDSLTAGGIPNSDWYDVGGGEAGYTASDPADPEIVYAGEYGGYLSRHDHRTGQSRVVGIYPENPSGHGGEDLRYRFQWTAPIALSPHDPKVVYHAANVLFRTTDGGQTWKAISPDLTRDDKSKEAWSGGPLTGDNTGVEIYCTIFAVAESPVEKGLIWAGSDDGLVHLTRDGGQTWTDVTAAMRGLPEWATVATIEPSHFDAGTAYVVVDAHRLDDLHPYLWKTADFGRTWKRLDGKLPQDLYLHAVREDPRHRGMLYLGTEHGVVLSTDDGATWHALRLNLPAVAVHDLAIKDDELVVATHGRSFWIFDHLPVLYALAAGDRLAGAAGKDGQAGRPRRGGRDGKAHAGGTGGGAAGAAAAGAHLLAVPDAVRWELRQGAEGWTGENPARGASIYYQLDGAPQGEVTIDILDARGTLVTTLSSKAIEPIGATERAEDEQEVLKQRLASKEAGVQRAVWDLSWAGAELIPGAKLDSGYPAHGPKALPGTYTVRLTVDGKSSTLPLTVHPDPRVTASQADLEAQLQLALEVRDAITRLTRTVVRLREVRQQLVSRNELIKADPRAEPLVKGSADLARKLDGLEAKLQNPKAEIVYDILAQRGGAQLYSRLSPLVEWVDSGDGPSTQGLREVFAGQQRELAARQADLDHLLVTDLAALNDAAAHLDLPRVYLPPAR
jgi:photosystem II stability/assembly factor-like uncharacterized protein